MGVATTVRDATNIERANENETRREMIAYWSKDEDSGDYSIIAVIPEKEASRIQGLKDAILMTGYPKRNHSNQNS